MYADPQRDARVAKESLVAAVALFLITRVAVSYANSSNRFAVHFVLMDKFVSATLGDFRFDNVRKTSSHCF